VVEEGVETGGDVVEADDPVADVEGDDDPGLALIDFSFCLPNPFFCCVCISSCHLNAPTVTASKICSSVVVSVAA
jgi:hypothetical protein